MKRATLLITALMGMFLASCGTSGGPEGYMASSPNSVIFIDWTNNNNQLTGMLQTTYLDNSLTLHSQSSQLSGVVSGSNVSLTLSLWGFPTQTYVGTISNDQLTLSIPQSNGTLQSVVLTPATTDDYNNVVHSLQATATAQQNAQATAQAISAAQSLCSTAR
jgi:hypothetical protein